MNYPPPLRFKGRASDWTQAVVDNPPFTPSIGWIVEHEQSHRGGTVPGHHRRAIVPSPAGHSPIKKLTTWSDNAGCIDPAKIVGVFGPRRCELSLLGTTARRHARRLVITVLLTAVAVVTAVYDPGFLLLITGVSTIIVGTDGPTLLIRLELGTLVGALAVGVPLVALIDRNPAVNLHAASGWLILVATGFLVGIVAVRQFASGLVGVLVGWSRIAADSQ